MGASQFRVRDDFRVLALCTVIRSEQSNMKAVLESKRDFLPLTFEPFEELARKEIIIREWQNQDRLLKRSEITCQGH